MFFSSLYLILKLLFAATGIFSLSLANPHARGTGEICLTEQCLAEAKFYQSNMDTTIDPCEDFYQFTCGNFIKNHANMLGTAPFIGSISKIQNAVNEDIVELVKGEVKPNDTATLKKIKTHYKNCMNTTRIEVDGTGPILELLKSFGGWPITIGSSWNESKFNLVDSLQILKKKKYPISFPFDLKNEDAALMDLTTSILAIKVPTLTSNSSFYSNYSKLSVAYLNFVKNTSILLGADELTFNEEAGQIQTFESKIFEATTLPDIPRVFTIKELSGNITTIPWLKLFNMILNASGIHVDENEPVLVENFAFFATLADLLDETPKRIVANYLGWTVLQNSMPYLPEKLRMLGVDFENARLGKNEVKSREQICLKSLKERLSIGVSSIYVQKNFNKEMKDDVYDMFAIIKDQIGKNLQKMDWLDEETRQHNHEKLKTMHANIAYIDKFIDDDKVDEYYGKLDIDPGNYLYSALNISFFELDKNYQSLRTKREKYGSLLKVMPSTTFMAAFRIAPLNLIGVSAAFLRGSFYQYNRPKYLNFGAMGTIIGHEITHGIGTSGILFDKDGNVANLNRIRGFTFSNRVMCFVHQYSNFVVKDINLKLNGYRTQDENVADYGGTTAAYRAYNEWESRNGKELSLPGLDYTPQQMFWISAASNWCSVMKPEILSELIENDSHSPYDARVLLTFSNIPEFARDFQCKVGSRMNPMDRCTLW